MIPIELVEGAGDEAIADWIAQRLARAFVRTEAPLAVAMPGGSTPFPIIAHLLRAELPWHRLTVWPTDDRIVPEDHSASNTGRLRRAFAPVGARVATLGEMEAVPHFALVWLGMGADGHIASLFPNTDPRADATEAVIRLTPDPLPPEAPFERVSLTIPALLDCDELLFTIRGADKRAVFDAAVAGDGGLPVARLLAAATQAVTCFA